MSEAYIWLNAHPTLIEFNILSKKIRNWRRMSVPQVMELNCLINAHGADPLITEVASDASMYSTRWTLPKDRLLYDGLYVLESATVGLWYRKETTGIHLGTGYWSAILQILEVLQERYLLSNLHHANLTILPFTIKRLVAMDDSRTAWLPVDASTWPKFIALARMLAEQLEKNKSVARHTRPQGTSRASTIPASAAAQVGGSVAALERWAGALERELVGSERTQAKRESVPSVKSRARASSAAIREGADRGRRSKGLAEPGAVADSG